MASLSADILAAIRDSMKATRTARAEHFPNEAQPGDQAIEDLARNAAMAVMSVVMDLADDYQGGRR